MTATCDATEKIWSHARFFIGIIKDKICLRIRISFNDPRNDKQECPQRREDSRQNINDDDP